MFSLRTLFVGVAYAALVCAALVTPSSYLGSSVVTLTLAIAAGATIAAWRTPSARGFYGPFAFVTWLYLGIVFYQPFEKLEQTLLTNEVLFRVWAHKKSAISGESDWTAWRQFFYTIDDLREELELIAFYTVSHCTAAVLLGLLAGWITAWVERKKKE